MIASSLNLWIVTVMHVMNQIVAVAACCCHWQHGSACPAAGGITASSQSRSIRIANVLLWPWATEHGSHSFLSTAMCVLVSPQVIRVIAHELPITDTCKRPPLQLLQAAVGQASGQASRNQRQMQQTCPCLRLLPCQPPYRLRTRTTITTLLTLLQRRRGPCSAGLHPFDVCRHFNA